MGTKQQANWWHNKWLALVGALWMLTPSGLSYVFSIFSAALKATMHYRQRQIDLLGTASDMGGNVGLLCGALSSLLPDWLMLAIGGVMNIIGFGTVWLSLAGYIAPLSLWAMCLFMFIGVNGATFFNTVGLVTSIRNFPRSRGVVVGLLKGMVGLSGAIYAQTYAALVAPDQLGFLLMVAIGPTCTAFLVLFILRPAPKDDVESDEGERRGYIKLLFLILITLAVYLVAEIIISSVHELDRAEKLTAFGGMMVLLLSPVVIPVWVHASPRMKQSTQIAGVGQKAEDNVKDGAKMGVKSSGRDVECGQCSIAEPLLAHAKEQNLSRSKEGQLAGDADVQGTPGHEQGAKGKESSSHDGGLPNFSIGESVRELNLWLLVISMTMGAGSGYCLLDNLAQVGAAQGYTDVAIPVALISIWNFAGRVGGGVYSESLLKKYGVPRPAVIGAAQGIMSIGFLLFAFAVPGSLYSGSFIVGGGLGITYGMVTAAASELFGLASFGMIYNIITTAIPFGSYLFSGVLAGSIYDMEAEAERKGLGSIWLPLQRKTGGLAKTAMNLLGVLGASNPGGRSLLSSSSLSAGRLLLAVPGAQSSPEGMENWEMVQRLYGYHSSEADLDHEYQCTGAHCFRLTFIMMAIVCLFGMAANFLLAHRSRGLYKQIQQSIGSKSVDPRTEEEGEL